MSHYFCQRQPQVPPRPIILVQRRPDLLQTAQRRGACVHSLVFTEFRSVFYQTVFCSFAVNKDHKNLHNHQHPPSCRGSAAALTRTPLAAKIKLTAVHTVGQRFSPFETSIWYDFCIGKWFGFSIVLVSKILWKLSMILVNVSLHLHRRHCCPHRREKIFEEILK